MKTLLTGATGFVGHHLIQALRARGWDIHLLALPVEDTSRLESQGVTVHRGDVCDPSTLVAPMRGMDAVFHLAGIHGLWRPREEYIRVNVGGTENVCVAALKSGAGRLFHISTWNVYRLAAGQPLHEESPLEPPPDNYTVSKAEGDRMVQRYMAEHKLPATIIRPAILFGPGDGVNFSRMAARLCSGQAVLIGSGGNALAFTYVTNIVEGMALAAASPRAVGQIYNLGTDQPLTQEEFWAAMAEDLGVRPPRLRVPYAAMYSAAWMAERLHALTPRRQPLVTRFGVQLFGTDNRISIEKARRELGYEPRVSVREGIRLTADWYLRQSRPAAAGAATAAHPGKAA